MNVVLKPRLEQFINDQVKEGHFASPIEALEAGIERLMLDYDSDEPDETEIAELKRSCEDMDCGNVIDLKDVVAIMRAKYPPK